MSVTLDGEERNDQEIPLVDELREHVVEVVLRAQ